MTVDKIEILYQPPTDRTWRVTLENALIITRREVRDSIRDWRIIGPIVILTFFFPFLAQGAAGAIRSFLSQYGAELLGEQFIPFLLMIVGFFPISISLVIALETFVGEKERRSLEPLLSTPLSNSELYIGKALAAMIPPLVASFGGMTFYLITLAWAGTPWNPPVLLIIQIFALTIMQALVMVTGAVVVSSQTTSTRAANLLASFIIIPMTLIVNAESVIILLAPDSRSDSGITALWAIIAGMIVVTILLLRVGNSLFNREELLGRTIDNFNLGGILRDVWRYICAIDDTGTPAKNLVDWYLRAIPHTLQNLKVPILITIGVFTIYAVIGVIIGQQPQFQLPLTGASLSVEGIAGGGFGAIPEGQAFWWILGNNSQILLLALVLSAFSFGVVAYILVPPVFIVMGYLAHQLVSVGLGQVFLVAIVPHGIFEIPAIVIATAAIFKLGSVITKPPQGDTVGHAWIITLGGTLKVSIGLVLPLLIIAALVEVYVTLPLLAQLIQGIS